MLRHKTWQYVALTSEEAFVSAAIAHLGYVGLVFATAYDRKTGQEVAFERIVPFARGIQVAPAPTTGSSTYHGSQGMMRFENDPRLVQLDLPNLQVNVQGDSVDPWKASWPIGRGRNDTIKEMGFACQGSVRLGTSTLSLDGHGMMDWTAGTPARQTDWRWAAGVARAGDRLVAWNLRTGFNDPAQVENALWVDGQPVSPGRAQIEPGDPWRITAGDLDLHFEPHGMRREDMNLFVITSRYQQPWGRFHGQFEGVPLEGYGVVEDHWAVW
ncbi:MAG TPA: DUF2804 domain-containing protein [Stenomitos sp.]